MINMSVPGRGDKSAKAYEGPVRTLRDFLLPWFIDHGDHNFKYYSTFYLGFSSGHIEMVPGQCWTFEWKSQPPFFGSNDTLRLTSQSNIDSFAVANTVQTFEKSSAQFPRSPKVLCPNLSSVWVNNDKQEIQESAFPQE